MPHHRTFAALLILLLGVGTLHCASRPFATGATVDTEFDFKVAQAIYKEEHSGFGHGSRMA